MAFRAPTALLAASLALAAAPLFAAPAKHSATLRVMLSPVAAEQGTLPAALRERLEDAAGTRLALVGTTRTGALDLAVAGPRDDASLAAVAKRLRTERSVLWVDPQPARTVTAKSAKAAPDAAVPGRKFLVRLAQQGTPDWPALLPQLSARVGAPLAVERAIGEVWVLSLPASVPTSQLVEMAQSLEQDALVRYADPVRRVRANGVVPNDPLFGRQWGLNDPVAGIGAGNAWALTTGASDITVAVVDTGILDHPDLAGRLLTGYDFISDAGRARDGDGRDPNPRDEGDWNDAGDCGGAPAADSFFHGLFVSGIIAANGNDGVGIAGLNWKGKVLPVRVLGECGGSIADVFEGMLWAAGVAIDGVPANPTPAKVINLSLGGYGSCGGALQEAVDLALAQGTVIVASAGNESDFVDNYAPANCGGVITVAASNRSGSLASYSNFGRRVDLAAPGGDGGSTDTLILSTYDTGTTTPQGPTYAYAAGTSFSAPLVSGVVSLMLSRNPTLTGGQVLSILTGTTRDFPAGSGACSRGTMCGSGLLDAGTALASTMPASTNLPDGAVAVVEYYDAARDHYFITADAAEIAQRDATGPGVRTGYVFYAWLDPMAAPAGVLLNSVCRFYAYDNGLVDSHFFTPNPAECGSLASSGGMWQLQSRAAFWIEVPDAAGACREGTVPVYRFFNNRFDANQRHTLDLSVRRGMINRAWVPDGPGPNGAVFCSPI